MFVEFGFISTNFRYTSFERDSFRLSIVIKFTSLVFS